MRQRGSVAIVWANEVWSLIGKGLVGKSDVKWLEIQAVFKYLKSWRYK